MNPSGDRTLYGALAEFASAEAIHHACEKVRDANYTRWDAHTPFPVHGLDRAMGLAPSKLGWVVFFGGLGGASLAMLMQWWMAAVDYKVIIAAKPYFSWQAFIPITFESMVLFASGSAVLSLLVFIGLPRWHHALLKTRSFEKVTDDRYFISIESSDAKFDRNGTVQFLRSLGAAQVELVEE